MIYRFTQSISQDFFGYFSCFANIIFDFSGGSEKDEDETSNKDDIEEDEVMDEELDEGTDYANNYFDNGENYLDDEDDNLDEGGIF